MSKYDWLLKDYNPDAEPRPSCLPLLKHRRALTSIMPGYARRLGGLWVKRTEAWRDYRYRINGVELTLEQTLDVVMGIKPAPRKKVNTDKLATAKAPRVFPTAIDHSEIVPTVALALPLELEAA